MAATSSRCPPARYRAATEPARCVRLGLRAALATRTEPARLRVPQDQNELVRVWPIRSERLCPRDPHGQADTRRGATRPLDACACAARPDYLVPGALKARWSRRVG